MTHPIQTTAHDYMLIITDDVIKWLGTVTVPEIISRGVKIWYNVGLKCFSSDIMLASKYSVSYSLLSLSLSLFFHANDGNGRETSWVWIVLVDRFI